MPAKEKIWIFGDSFADPQHGEPRGAREYQWVHQLGAKYSCTNYALEATGPHWAINKWFDTLDKYSGDPSEVSVIFIESEATRFMLESLGNETSQVVAPWKFAPGNKPIIDKHRSHLEWMFTQYTTEEWYKSETIKLIGAGALLAASHKKVLYWPLNDNPEHYRLVNNLPKNFTFAGLGLRHVSLMERGRYKLKKDNRSNHLLKESHDLMYEAVSEWMDTGSFTNPWGDEMRIKDPQNIKIFGKDRIDEYNKKYG